MGTKNRTSFIWVMAMVILALTVTACEKSIRRNPDGSLSVQTGITQQELNTAIQSSLADPLIKEVNVSLQSGYILVTGERQRLNDSSKTDALTFRLDLTAANGHLSASVSNAPVDGVAVGQARVEVWNQTIVNHLEKLAQRRPNTAFQSVSITTDAVKMTWQIAK